MKLFILICTKNRHENLMASLQTNIKYLNSCSVIIVDASEKIFKVESNIKNVRILSAERPGQFNQKVQGCEYIRLNHPDATHVLFLDDDIHLDRNIDNFVQDQYCKLPTKINQSVLTLYIENLQKMGRLEFLRVHSFKSGKLSKNTFTNKNCIGRIEKVEWALGGCSCWPIEFCPSLIHKFPIMGKAYTEDIFLSMFCRPVVSYYSSEKTSFKEIDLTKSSVNIQSHYKDALNEISARKYLCDRFGYFSKRYLTISVVFYSAILLLKYIFTLRVNKIGYAIGLLAGLFHKNRYISD
jgi:hypothetical protein